jgi:hypothetical protein
MTNQNIDYLTISHAINHFLIFDLSKNLLSFAKIENKEVVDGMGNGQLINIVVCRWQWQSCAISSDTNYRICHSD